MKKVILILFLTLSTALSAQQDAWIYFTDKPNAATYLANPLTMLTQRSLDRRAAQNIALDLKDVPISQDYINTLSSTPGVTVYAKSKWLNAVHVRGTVADIQSLLDYTFVSAIDFADDALDTNGNRPAMSHRPASFLKAQEIMVNLPYGNSQNQVAMLHGNQLHIDDYTGAGKVIAVLDAGFPGVDVLDAFSRLRNNNHILGGYDFVNRAPNFYTSNNHGTAVLSTMGAYVENQMVGSAPDADYYLFITESNLDENPLEESLWVEAAEEADRLGVDIITTSLGYFHFVNAAYNYDYNDMNGTKAFISRGADIAFTRGIVVVASAGNSGASATDPHIGVPADALNVLAVGAVDANEQHAVFSSIGPSADGRVKPDITAQGEQAIVVNSSGEIQAANGTSFSAPIIAGLTACLWQALPDKSNAEIVSLIRQSADHYTNPDALYGYGIPDFAAAVIAAGIDDNVLPSYAVYPNPVKETLSIKTADFAANAEIYLYNTTGQLVLQQQITTALSQINLQRLAQGIYLYRISADNIHATGRIIKQ
ncbi:S8 family serine peptidase [Flavobacterium pallidum]|uniref:Peptidase S8 n=1 Tax=Flavobacterium pallidum TaxID=2172098 RepID=A0A2S1SI87_9FLAO|nr:S8 family serine peptidase [Flavobacterium pallidum]AWI26128.1 peptidase S8 [Flavobacterium pallidum]